MFTSHQINFARFSSLLLAATVAMGSVGCHAASGGGIASGARHPAMETAQLLDDVLLQAPSANDASCIRIQRAGNTAVADTHLSELRKDANYGIDPSSRLGASDISEYRTLVAFDLRDIPRGAVVTHATMSLVRRTGGRANMTVHRITDTWNEHETTWSSFGNAYDSNGEATIQLGETSEEGRISFDMTKLVQSWISGEYANDGVLVKDSEGYSAFAMSESYAAKDHPQLEVCYVSADFAKTYGHRVASR